MFNETNFVVRTSGRRENSYYIDYSGIYKITDIAKIVGITSPELKKKYLAFGAEHDETLDVYYFNSIESAKKAIDDILHSMQPGVRGKVVYLTDAEIEYIRKALINEGSNIIHVSNKIKDDLFRKLNR